MDQKDIDKLIAYIKKEDISPAQALGIIQRANQVNASNYRTHWKMTRFTLYLWARYREYKRGGMKAKIETVREVVSSSKFKRLYDTYPMNRTINMRLEAKRLNQLIAEASQQIHFRSKNFVFEGTKKNIPQDIINKIK
tara:strand:- start:92 stop:505 length:414 start_codon:yes stop_codon:yes gene_type:complete